MGKSEMYQEKR